MDYGNVADFLDGENRGMVLEPANWKRIFFNKNKYLIITLAALVYINFNAIFDSRADAEMNEYHYRVKILRITQ